MASQWLILWYSTELASTNIALVSYLIDWHPARVAESADAGDSKSLSLRGVRVQVPPRAQKIYLMGTVRQSLIIQFMELRSVDTSSAIYSDRLTDVRYACASKIA